MTHEGFNIAGTSVVLRKEEGDIEAYGVGCVEVCRRLSLRNEHLW